MTFELAIQNLHPMCSRTTSVVAEHAVMPASSHVANAKPQFIAAQRSSEHPQLQIYSTRLDIC